MTLPYKTQQQITDRVRGDIGAIDGLDPTLFATFIRPLAESGGNRSFDLQELIRLLEKMSFPQTAIDTYLDLWLSYEGLTGDPATGSEGAITLEGTIGKTLDADDELNSEDSVVYALTAGVTFANQLINVTSLTRSGTTVTATTPSAHSLATGIDIDILGAVETDYNGTYEIIVLSATTFTYEITTTPTTPATGTITADFDGAFGEVVSTVVNDSKNDVNVNLDSGAKLTLSIPVIGIESTARVQFTGITGGADAESNESKFSRLMQSRTNPVANFNPTAITKECLKVSGVTRVKVKRITPYVGAVTILFVRDNDSNIIPDGGEVQDVRDVLLEILPAQSSEDDLFVTAPTPVSTNYDFASISPDTPTMREAVDASLDAFYRDSVTFEQDITEDKYRSAIIDTVDPETGEILQSFTLNLPSGDIPVTTNEIGIKGTVTFA